MIKILTTIVLAATFASGTTNASPLNNPSTVYALSENQSDPVELSFSPDRMILNKLCIDGTVYLNTRLRLMKANHSLTPYILNGQYVSCPRNPKADSK